MFTFLQSRGSKREREREGKKVRCRSRWWFFAHKKRTPPPTESHLWSERGFPGASAHCVWYFDWRIRSLKERRRERRRTVERGIKRRRQITQKDVKKKWCSELLSWIIRVMGGKHPVKKARIRKAGVWSHLFFLLLFLPQFRNYYIRACEHLFEFWCTDDTFYSTWSHVLYAQYRIHANWIVESLLEHFELEVYLTKCLCGVHKQTSRIVCF